MDYLNMIALLCLNFSIACFLTAFYVNAYKKECLKEDLSKFKYKNKNVLTFELQPTGKIKVLKEGEKVLNKDNITEYIKRIEEDLNIEKNNIDLILNEKSFKIDNFYDKFIKPLNGINKEDYYKLIKNKGE